MDDKIKNCLLTQLKPFPKHLETNYVKPNFTTCKIRNNIPHTVTANKKQVFLLLLFNEISKKP